jgi:anti-anti-sigma regulatory factor
LEGYVYETDEQNNKKQIGGFLSYQADPVQGEIILDGEIDLSNSDQLLKGLLDCTENSNAITLDVANVRFIGAAGMHTLIELGNVSDLLDKPYQIKNPSDIFIKINEIVGGDLQTRYVFDDNDSNPQTTQSIRSLDSA